MNHPENDLSTAGSAPRRKSRFPLVAAVIIAAIIAVFFLSRRGTEKTRGQKQPQRPVPVSVVPARTADVNVYLSGLGSVVPNNSVTVRSRVDGQLMRIHFKEGDMVRSGQLLAEIDPRPFQAQIAQAEGQLAKDAALLRNAKLDLERYQLLARQDSIAKQQLDTQEALVRQYEGTVKADQGAIQTARLQLIYSRITAPVGGRTGLRQVDAGNIIHASDANGIVLITQVQPVNVLFTLPEDDIQRLMKKLRGGRKLGVDAYNREGTQRLAAGRLDTVDNQIDPTTGTVKLKAVFDNRGNELFPSQFVNAKLLLDVKRGAVVVPAAAIQRGQAGTFVYVVQPDKTVAMKPVKMGPADGDNVAVEGIAAGESVVIEGADKLRQGAKVELQGARPRDGQGGRPGGGTPGKSPAEGHRGAQGGRPAEGTR